MYFTRCTLKTKQIQTTKARQTNKQATPLPSPKSTKQTKKENKQKSQTGNTKHTPEITTEDILFVDC